ncbi:MAG: peptidase C39 family protein [Marmoricola sp.]
MRLARPIIAATTLALVAAAGVVLEDRHGTDQARLAAATAPPSQYASLDPASLHLAERPSARTWAGRSYHWSAGTSGWITPLRSFTQLVPSWTATTPAGSWIQVLVQVRDTAGKVSGLEDLGRWSTRDAGFERSSAGSQQDEVARVATDTLVATGRPLAAYRVTVRLMRTSTAPRLTALGAVTSTPATTVSATSLPLQHNAVNLAVPRYSQMIHRGQARAYGGGGEAWCSPTSLSMVLGYYGRLPAAATYTWVPRSYADRWVDHVARLTYDYAYDGTGNWPFNTAYAATRTGSAFVTRLANLRMAERFVRAGIPLVISIRFARGQLSGAPIAATAGHLVVLAGFTATGDPVINDPAAPTDASVRHVYDRTQLEQAWLRGSDGMAYVVRDAKHPLPKRPAGVRNW